METGISELRDIRKKLVKQLENQSFNISSDFTSPNRAYPASLHFVQIPLRGTSDTLGPLGEISFWR